MSVGPRQRVHDRLSVRTRLSVVSTVAVVVGLAGASTVAYVVTSRVLHQQIDDALLASSTSVGQRDPQPVPSIAPESLCELLRDTDAPAPGQFVVELRTADGTVCRNGSQPGLVLDRLPDVADDVQLVDAELDDGHAARVAYVRAADGATLVLGRDVESVDSVLATLRVTLAAVTLLGALTALALSQWTSRAGLRPITRFARVAETIAETGRLDLDDITPAHPVGRRSRDELDRLAQAFTKMTSALADAQERQRRLVADAGHELRTPLSSLRANVDLLLRARRSGRDLIPADEDRLLHDLAEQLLELSSLVNDLSALAAPSTTTNQLATTRLDTCIEQALRRVRMRAGERRFDVALDPVSVLGDENELEKAVVNLLDNAVKFSPDRSVIEVRCSAGVVTVVDHGRGIGEREATRAFERFWRSPRARSLPGSGLGLSIVQDVAQRHGGWARLGSHPDGGTVATFFIPPLATTPDEL